MTANFIITTAGTTAEPHYIFDRFIDNLRDIASVFGYAIIDEDDDGNVLTSKGSPFEAKASVPRCHDFYIKKDGLEENRSRYYRMQCVTKANSPAYIGVLGEEISSGKTAFRDYEMLRYGKSYFLADYILNKDGSPRWDKNTFDITAPGVYYFKVTVNDEMLLVFCRRGEEKIYSCCLSFIKLYDVYDVRKSVWLSNSSFSDGDDRIQVEIPFNPKGKTPYAKLGVYLQAMQYDGSRWGTGRVIVLPKAKRDFRQ